MLNGCAETGTNNTSISNGGRNQNRMSASDKVGAAVYRPVIKLGLPYMRYPTLSRSLQPGQKGTARHRAPGSTHDVNQATGCTVLDVH